MKRCIIGCSVVVAVMVGGPVGEAQAQSFTYTFTSGSSGDGFNWPASPTGMLGFDSFFTPQDVEVFNATGNNVFFDQQYQVAGNTTRIQGDALWGNPLNLGGSYVAFDFSSMGSGAVQDVSFDFAWSQAGVPDTSEFLSIYIEDYDGRASFNSYQLSDTFPGFGGNTGYEGTIVLSTSFLTDDFFNVDGGAFADIRYMEVHVADIVGNGPSSEYAIDNFAVNGGGGIDPGLDPENSNVFPGELGGGLIGQSSKWLRTTSTSFASLSGFEVSNDGSGGTTYTVSVDPGSDPEWIVNSPATGETIFGGQQINEGSGDVAFLDRNNPSGTYTADIIVSNDLNGLDPDETVFWTIELYDAPDLTDDSGSTVQVDIDNSIFISNADVLPHAGALRAGVEVSNRQISGPFKFSTSTGDLVNGAFVAPDETKTATIEFDRYGRINGNYNGTASVSLVMNSAPGSFLNGDPPLPDTVWNLSYNLGTVSNDSVTLNTNDDLGPGVIGVNDAQTAATLLGGVSAANQNVSMALTTDPGTNADLAGTPVELTFGGGNVDLYVMQFTYLDGNLPVGTIESQLQVLFYDTITGEWDAAVDGNSGGTATFFNGSYADYLSTVGGGVLDAGDLGAFGVDTVNNHAWAILDHASIFGVGVLTTGTLEGDLNGDGFVGIADLNVVLGNWNQNVTPGDPLLGDPSGDGFVGIADLNVVLGNWNAGTPPTAEANIPEPGTLAVVWLSALGVFGRRVRVA